MRGLQPLHQRFEFGDGVTQQRRIQIGPAQRRDLQELFDLGGHAGQHRLESNHQRPEQVQAHAAHGLNLRLGTGLFGQRPGFLFVNVLIGAVGQRHDFAHGPAKLPSFVSFGDGSAGGDKFGVQRGFGEFPG